LEEKEREEFTRRKIIKSSQQKKLSQKDISWLIENNIA
jgi:vacuolar-type H+-ATPase subunit D/Vma8